MAWSRKIPLCQSEFLQDFSIALGLHPNSKGRRGWYLRAVDICEEDGEFLERLSLRAQQVNYTRTKLVLWEDRTIWVSVALLALDKTEEYKISFYPNFEPLGFVGIIEALEYTDSVSTRLCYGESPLPILRRLWKHAGEVETAGALVRVV